MLSTSNNQQKEHKKQRIGSNSLLKAFESITPNFNDKQTRSIVIQKPKSKSFIKNILFHNSQTKNLRTKTKTHSDL